MGSWAKDGVQFLLVDAQGRGADDYWLISDMPTPERPLFDEIETDDNEDASWTGRSSLVCCLCRVETCHIRAVAFSEDGMRRLLALLRDDPCIGDYYSLCVIYRDNAEKAVAAGAQNMDLEDSPAEPAATPA